MALTKRTIDTNKYDPTGPASQILWDGDLPGFGLRLFPSGAASFILDYRGTDGRKRRVTLGRYGVLTPAQARTMAQRTLAGVLDGASPADQKKAAREAVTLDDFADEYIRRHARPRKRTWAQDRRVLDRDILPVLGTRQLASITRADVAALHSRIGETAPYAANRLLALTKVMRTCAIEWGHLPEHFPGWRVKPFAERSRDRWIKPDELRGLLDAMAAEPSTHVRGVLLLALLTGMRRGEMLGLRWQDVDLSRREIHLPDTKAGRSHVVPLSDDATALLAEMPKLLGNPYVFPSDVVPGTHMADMNRPWGRVRGRVWLAQHPDEVDALHMRARADVERRSKHADKSDDAVQSRMLQLATAQAKERGEDIRLHDVRRTTGSLLALAGASLPLIGAVLNHSNASTTQVYARLTEDAPRAALELLAAQVRAAGGPS